MILLAQFLFRLSLGMSVAMAVTSPKLVSSGYFRNNLYVLLGLNVLATLLATRGDNTYPLPLGLPIAAAVVSYVAAVAWLYEQPRLGVALLWLLGGITAMAAWWATPALAEVSLATEPFRYGLQILDPLAGGLLLGGVNAAMLLGHWYLNVPGMRLEPLWQLLSLLAVATAVRILLAAGGLGADWLAGTPTDTAFWLFLGLRWLAGLVAMAVLLEMTRQTLKIPNTQSATGMLYVAVIVVFLGELTAMLLSAGRPYPL